jgi:hypothetical protein
MGAMVKGVKDQGREVVYSGGISAALGRGIGMGAVKGGPVVYGGRVWTGVTQLPLWTGGIVTASSGLMHGGSSLGTGTTVTLLVGLVGLILSGVGGQAGERAVTWTQAGVNGLEEGIPWLISFEVFCFVGVGWSYILATTTTSADVGHTGSRTEHGQYGLKEGPLTEGLVPSAASLTLLLTVTLLVELAHRQAGQRTQVSSQIGN